MKLLSGYIKVPHDARSTYCRRQILKIINIIKKMKAKQLKFQ